jgi:hypothetical protein
MSEVAFVHKTTVPSNLSKNFVCDWWFLTKVYGSPDATLHVEKGNENYRDGRDDYYRFIQLVIWPTREEAENFFNRTIVFNVDANRMFNRYKSYTEPRQEVTIEELLRYRSELSQPLRTIRK